MRQIGDQWRPIRDEDEKDKKPIDLGFDRPLDSEEEISVEKYYSFRFKTTFNNFCSEKFISNATKDFINNFNKCTEKFHQIESIYYRTKKEFSHDVELYAKSGLHNLKY